MSEDKDARIRLLEQTIKDCLEHIDLLEGHLPMNNAADEEVYKESIMFGEKVSAVLNS